MKNKYICNSAVGCMCNKNNSTCDGHVDFMGCNNLCMENNHENQLCIQKCNEYDIAKTLKDKKLSELAMIRAVINIAKKDKKEAMNGVSGAHAERMVELMKRYNL